MIGKDTMYSLPLLVSFPRQQESVEIIKEELGLDQRESDLANELFEKGLPVLASPECLPYMFGISHRLIGLMEAKTHLFYRIYTVGKVGGGLREIQAPRRFLKIIQTWINEYICTKASPPECVTGFVRGRSIFDNARVHAGGGNLMVVDIEDFFPSITFEKVERVFASFGFPPGVARQLAALCCLHNRLPQGAPTSPAIANLVCKPLDEKLLELAKDWGAKYSRYADDLSFSGPVRFDNTHKSS